MDTGILVIGGASDPNVLAVLQAARSLHVKAVPLLTKIDESPPVTWDIGENKLSVGGKAIFPRGVFIRRDVFHTGTADAAQRALAWYETWQGWLASQRGIRVLNRSYLGKYTNKLAVLELARKIGFTIPPSRVTNDLSAIGHFKQTDTVAKPVTGGGYCRMVDEILDNTEFQNKSAANPAIVQKLVPGDDIRIYRIDQYFIGFRIRTKAIDYRTTRNYLIEMMPDLPLEISYKLKKMMDTLGLDWGAADFKESFENGEHYFLEVNSNPMFSVFDKVAKGFIREEVIKFLAKNGRNNKSTAFTHTT